LDTVFPPSVVGAVNATDRVWEADGVTELMVGAPAVVEGVAFTVTLPSPVPLLLTALMDTPYDDPLVRPVMTSGLAVDAGVRAVHVSPPSVEYW
jgi:hypothetical protein